MATQQTAVSAALFATLIASILAGCTDEAGPLEAVFTATSLDAEKTRFRFDAAGDADGRTFTWDFGDRSEPKTGRSVEHAYEFPNGDYRVKLTVTDATGASDESEQKVTVGAQPNSAPLLYLQVDRRLAAVGEAVLFDASQSVDADGDPLFFQWDFNSKLEQKEFDDIENLGNHQYGRYPAGKPAPGSPNGGEPAEEPAPEDGLTPSGHVWADEVEKAQARLLKRLGIERLDGDHSVPMEPRNTDFDGVIDDESPIQMFAFPSPATYFVHVRVTDIKGEGQDGYIRIKVQETAPSLTNTTRLADTLEPAPLSNAQAVTSAHGVEAAIPYTFRYEYPATSRATLAYEVTPSVGDSKVALYVCGTNDLNKCMQGIPLAKLEAGASGRELTWTVGPDQVLPYAYTLFVANEGNALVEYDFTVETAFDLNPWAREEAGFAVAH